jgi:hypothetical protein
MQDTLPKVLISLASESPNSSSTLSSFASGGWYVATAVCFLQGDAGTKVKTPGAGKNMVRGFAGSYYGEAL